MMFRGIKLKPINLRRWQNEIVDGIYRGHWVEGDNKIAVDGLTVGKDGHPRMVLSGGSFGETMGKASPNGRNGPNPPIDPQNTATLWRVAKKNNLGLALGAWLFAYRNKVYYRITGNGLSKAGNRSSQRGQGTINQRRLTTKVRYVGPWLPELDSSGLDSPEWSTITGNLHANRVDINALVGAAYDDKGVLPVIADALEEAGLQDQNVLTNLKA